MLVLHLYVVGNFLFRFQRLLVVAHLDALQNLVALNLDVLLPFLDVVHLVVVLVDAVLRHLLRMDYFLDVVDAVLRHLLRMDYFLDVVVVELHHLQRMDYFLDAVQMELMELHLVQEALVLQLLPLLQPLPLLVQPFQHRVMPSALQDRRRVRRQVLQLILDLLQHSS